MFKIISRSSIDIVVLRVFPLAWLCVGLGCSSSEQSKIRQLSPTEVQALSANQKAPCQLPSPLSYSHDVKPLLEKYCVDCHGAPKPSGGLDLEAIGTEAEALQQAWIWRAVRSRLGSATMPPPNSPAPATCEKQLLESWANEALGRCDSNLSPGPVGLHRLNRDEYDNSLRDILQDQTKPAQNFPFDEIGYGFDNNAALLSLAPILFERVSDAAESAAARAVTRAPDLSPITFSVLGTELKREGSAGKIMPDGAQLLYDGGSLSTSVWSGVAADYRLKLALYQEKAGTEDARALVRVNEQDQRTITVSALAASPQQEELLIRLSPGLNRLTLSFINDFYDPHNPDPLIRDRNLAVLSVKVEGPTQAAPYTPSPIENEILSCDPQAMGAESCAPKILEPLVRRAYRRPARPDELHRLTALTLSAIQAGDSFEQGIRLALEAILSSPYFLFRVEHTAPGSPGQPTRLDGVSLASRLSYFLWSSAPDERLLSLGEQDRLVDPLVFSGELRRMLDDPKAAKFTENFAGQWLGFRETPNVQLDPVTFPNFDQELATSMKTEAELFMQTLLKENRSVLEVLDSHFTFVDSRLAQHYGWPKPAGTGFERVEIPIDDPEARGGVLAQGSFFALTSHPNRTSPVRRGKWILDRLLCQSPPPPPANVPPLPPTQNGTMTARELLAHHRANPACASCHTMMDPLGLGLENFDALGLWRAQDGGITLDPAGTLPNGQTFSGPRELKRLLSESAEFPRCFSEKLMTFALGRGLRHEDQCALEQVTRAAEKKGYALESFIQGVSMSPQFQKGEEN